MLEDVIRSYGGVEVTSMDVYTDMFHLGEHYIQIENEASGEFKSNPLAYMKNNNSSKGTYRIMFEDTFEEVLHELQQADFAILNGISYFGKKNIQENASKMYALIIDLDGVDDKSLNNFLYAAFSKDFLIYPVPNYMVLSGHGVHLYYVFEEPIPLYPNIKMQLKEVKYELMRKIWNRNVTSLYERIQFQGINQGFRVIGGKTKIDGVKSRAFRLNTHPFSIDVLNQYIPEEKRLDQKKLWRESKLTLEEAKKKYPEWYQRRVLSHENCLSWTCKEALYWWWLRQIKKGAAYGHRYFCVMCLAIYAVKSGISKEQLEKDAMDLIPFLTDLNKSDPFTESDVKSALECYDERYKTFPIDDIVKLTTIPIQKNKRNYRKQNLHLRLARANRDILCEERGKKDWREGSGRPVGSGTAEEKVKQWQLEHPEGKKADCIRETGLSKPTVYKWWGKNG